jgi:hypothetical protein
MQSTVEFDYVNQAWVVDGIVQDCGHIEPCYCFGRTHKGQKHVDLCKSSACNVCHALNTSLHYADQPMQIPVDYINTTVNDTPVSIKVTRKVWSKGDVKEWLAKCEEKSDCSKTRAIVTRALLFMYARQTQDEQSSQQTSHSNGIGFTGVDAEFLSSVAQKCIKYKNDISPKQFIYVRKKLVKYSGQLVEFANSL